MGGLTAGWATPSWPHTIGLKVRERRSAAVQMPSRCPYPLGPVPRAGRAQRVREDNDPRRGRVPWPTRWRWARGVSAEFITHPDRDPGCFLYAQNLLQTHHGRAGHALVVFDHEGSNRSLDREATEDAVRGRLAASGWGTRCAAIAIAPELEVWAWSDSPWVDEVLGWSGRRPTLRDWLRKQGWLEEGAAKPVRPKEALEAALRRTGKHRSAALFSELAQRVGFASCTDPAFQALRATLQGWFAERGG